MLKTPNLHHPITGAPEMDPATVSNDDIRLTADAPEMRVSFANGVDIAATVEQAANILKREGVVVLDDLVDPALLETCRNELIERYPDYAEPNEELYLGSYPGRHTAPIVIDETLAQPKIFAPEPVMKIVGELLGPQRILESLGLLVSLPGSPNQGRHHDGLLYVETHLDRVVPPFAISIAMPLVELDEVTGTTAFWLRTHRQPDREGPPDFAPAVPVGSAILWDFRVHHSGRGNLGSAPRPVLFSVHSRDWWQEPPTVKATKYKKLQISKALSEGLSDWMRIFLRRAEIAD